MSKFSFCRNIILLLILFFLYSDNIFSKDDSTDFRKEDKLRIREAINIFNEYGNSIWKNWDTAPFAILLVTNDNEYLMNHTNPSADFKLLGYDSIIGSDVYTRPGQFSNNMLATFPAVNGVSTIVVGLPENTSRPGVEWIITILHEHFHQLQSSQADYYASVESLDLAGGDESGMWMLNYKFPYSDKLVSDQYHALIQSAKKTYLSPDNPEFENNLSYYLSEREKFKALLIKKDYDYFSFQIWQEGIARYTEIKIADFIRKNYKPAMEAAQLDDYITMDSFYVRILNRQLENAESQSLSDSERNCFYTLGALEGLILDKANPGWKDLYLKEKFYLEKYFDLSK